MEEELVIALFSPYPKEDIGKLLRIRNIVIEEEIDMLDTLGISIKNRDIEYTDSNSISSLLV